MEVSKIQNACGSQSLKQPCFIIWIGRKITKLIFYIPKKIIEFIQYFFKTPPNPPSFKESLSISNLLAPIESETLLSDEENADEYEIIPETPSNTPPEMQNPIKPYGLIDWFLYGNSENIYCQLDK